MDWTGRLTLIFAGIGAMTGLLTVANEWMKRRAEGAARTEAEAQAWALNAGPTQRPDRWVLALRYDAAQDHPVTMREIRILEPRTAEIARIQTDGKSRVIAQEPVPIDDQWSKVISVNRDLDPGILLQPGHGASYAGYATSRLLAQISSKALRRSGRARFHISLTIKERSAARRQRKIIVTSQEIAWTARKTDINA